MGNLLNYIVAWPKWVPILSWITGWVNVAGWVGNSSPTSIFYAAADGRTGRADCGKFPFVEPTDHWDYLCNAPSKTFILCITSYLGFVTAGLGL